MFKNIYYISYDSRTVKKENFISECGKHGIGSNITLLKCEKHKITNVKRYLSYIKLFSIITEKNITDPVLVCDGIVGFDCKIDDNFERIFRQESQEESCEDIFSDMDCWDVKILSKKSISSLFIINPAKARFIKDYLMASLPFRERDSVSIEDILFTSKDLRISKYVYDDTKKNTKVNTLEDTSANVETPTVVEPIPI